MMARRFRRALARFRDDDRGNATVEFALLFPVLIALFVSTVEIGIANVRDVMIARGTDLVVRDLRLGSQVPPSPEDLKTRLCGHIGPIVPDCENVIRVELHPIDMATWSPMPRFVDCIDRDRPYQPAVTADYGSNQNLMLIRVCAVVDPIMPTFGLGLAMPKDSSGGYRLATASIFVNEPD